MVVASDMLRLGIFVVAALAACFVPVSASDKDWLETALIYQIYPRSYKDSNGDGIGDLNGISEKLPYLKELAVDAIWLSPIFLSPMVDFGYDITNYTHIAPEYGTMQDFDNLMKNAKANGIKVVLDLVPNHTSNQSEWFLKSAKRQDGYDDYYVWADGVNKTDGTRGPPNNWISIFRKSAWEWNEDRQQYFLHQFVIGQPDLNYRSPKVQEEMKNVIRFWLDKGVSGFRVDAINMMYEVDPRMHGGKFPDEPLSGDRNAGPDDYEYLTHIYSKDLPETYDVVYSWRDLMTEYLNRDGEYKVMLTEAYTDVDLMLRYYGNGKRNGSIPMNFSFLGEVSNSSSAKDIKIVIDKWMTYMPMGKTANWVNGNHDQMRMASRLGTDRVDAHNMMALLLPGVTLTYQGEELGMVDGEVSWEETLDPQACNTEDPVNYWKKSRDPCRTPFHWDATNMAGFTTGNTTWLPVASTYKQINAKLEMNATKSHYKFYKEVAHAKKTNAVMRGDLETRALSDSVLAIARLLPGSPAIVGVVNLSNENQVADLSSIRLLPSKLTVIASGVNCNLAQGANVTKTSVTLSPHAAVLLKSNDNVPVINI